MTGPGGRGREGRNPGGAGRNRQGARNCQRSSDQHGVLGLAKALPQWSQHCYASQREAGVECIPQPWSGQAARHLEVYNGWLLLPMLADMHGWRGSTPHTLIVASLELSSQQLKTSSKHKAGAALSL